MFKKYFKIYGAVFILLVGMGCSTKHFYENVYPSVGFYALKVFATLNTINENFVPGVVQTGLTLKNSTIEHYKSSGRIQNHQKKHYTAYSYFVSVEGSSLNKSPLSVAALVKENPWGYAQQAQTQKISMNTMNLLATNTSYSGLSGSHGKGLPAVISDHQFFTIETGELPKVNVTITNGVFYPKSIGITSPLSPLSLAYYPDGPFQGNIPSYSVDSQGQTQTRISPADLAVIMNVF